MQLLHETPVLSRAQLRTVLGAPSPVDGSIVPSPFGPLSALDLADQVELIKITPITLTTEDLSKMWTAMQARYRPTMAYMISVVLIQVAGGARTAPPVLTRGPEDRGPVALAAPFPSLTGVRPAASDLLPAMRLGDDVLVTGTNLDAQGTPVAVFENTRAGLVAEITPPPAASSKSLTVHIPAIADDADAMHQWAVGLYTVALRVSRPKVPTWITNGVPIALAPLITVSPLTAPAGDIDLTVTCTPRLRAEQEAHTSLLFGGRAVVPGTIATPGDQTQPTTLTFTVPAVAAGQHLVRLRVAGIDSVPVIIAGPSGNLSFDSKQKVTVT